MICRSLTWQIIELAKGTEKRRKDTENKRHGTWGKNAWIPIKRKMAWECVSSRTVLVHMA